jgi:hypothetical protein
VGEPVQSSPQEPEQVSRQTFGSDISFESLCKELSLVCCRWFPLLHLLDNRANLRSRKGLVTVNLLDNFLNILKLFMRWKVISQNCYDREWVR